MSALSSEAQQALDALRSAVAEAFERKRRLGQYAVIWRDGKVLRIDPKDTPPSEKPGRSDKVA